MINLACLQFSAGQAADSGFISVCLRLTANFRDEHRRTTSGGQVVEDRASLQGRN